MRKNQGMIHFKYLSCHQKMKCNLNRGVAALYQFEMRIFFSCGVTVLHLRSLHYLTLKKTKQLVAGCMKYADNTARQGNSIVGLYWFI